MLACCCPWAGEGSNSRNFQSQGTHCKTLMGRLSFQDCILYSHVLKSDNAGNFWLDLFAKYTNLSSDVFYILPENGADWWCFFFFIYCPSNLLIYILLPKPVNTFPFLHAPLIYLYHFYQYNFFTFIDITLSLLYWYVFIIFIDISLSLLYWYLCHFYWHNLYHFYLYIFITFFIYLFHFYLYIFITFIDIYLSKKNLKTYVDALA